MAELSAAQRGVAHLDQLRACGIAPGAIAYRRATGRLHPVFRAVLAIGSPKLEPLALETAALLSVGDDAFLSNRAATVLWQMVAPRPGDGVEVTMIGRGRETRPGLRCHRVTAIDLRDLRLHRGLPVTAPARTLIDFAAEATASETADALNEARLLWNLTNEEIEAAMTRCPRRSGIRRLRAVLAAEHGRGYTESWLERQFRALVKDAQLPPPLYGQPLLEYRADVLWPRERVIVELDGRGTHRRPRAFETDRRRDQRLAAAGYVVLRVTGEQLRLERLAVAVRVAQTLTIAALRMGLI